MGIKTLIEFAENDNIIIELLVKERAKCRRRNRSAKHHMLDKNQAFEDITSTREMLSRMMPPRHNWVKLSKSKRKKLADKAGSDSKKAEKALRTTIKHDREKQKEGAHFDYLEVLDNYIKHIRERLADPQLGFDEPAFVPIFKDKKRLDDGTFEVTCRPLSVYTNLDDKIILALTYRYLNRYFSRYLHPNILSYRPPRDFNGKKHHVTDFSDGAELIKEFLMNHYSDDIYAADCDIKKFYDTFHHQTVRECFRRLLNLSSLSDEGKDQVMRVLEEYLQSFNFYDHVLKKAADNPGLFGKIRKKLHDRENKNTYLVGKVKEISDEEYKHRGVPQGGALSLMIANVVLNDVDQAIVSTPDENRLFIRYCDDMILLHTKHEECKRLMKLYTDLLSDHRLFYHNFESVSDSKTTSGKFNKAAATTNHFWKIKSHRPFFWGRGDGDSNLYIGFLGYEIRRDGRIRLRKSNIMGFKDKFNRLRYALYRYKKGNKDKVDFNEEFDARLNKTLNTPLKGLNFYKALNLDAFKKGSQYKYIVKLQELTRRRVK